MAEQTTINDKLEQPEQPWQPKPGEYVYESRVKRRWRFLYYMESLEGDYNCYVESNSMAYKAHTKELSPWRESTGEIVEPITGVKVRVTKNSIETKVEVVG